MPVAQVADARPPTDVAPPAAQLDEPDDRRPPRIGPRQGLFDCDPRVRPALDAVKARALPFKLGPCPKLPDELGPVTWGMNVATALKISHATRLDASTPDAVTADLAVGSVHVMLDFDEGGHLVSAITDTDGAGVEALAAAWGASLQCRHDRYWFDAATRTRVEVSPIAGLSDRYSVTFRHYTPLTQLLAGDGQHLQKVLARLPEVGTVVTGDAAITSHPTSLLLGVDPFDLDLDLEVGDDDKVEAYRLWLATEDCPQAHDEYAAEVAAALGVPTSATWGDDDEARFAFAGPGRYHLVLVGSDHRWEVLVSK